MNKNIIVKVSIPCCDGSECIATAYPVMRNRIITAYHALFPEDCQSEGSTTIKLSWPGLENGPVVKISKEDVLWSNKESYDIAVVRCDFPNGVVGVSVSADRKPEDNSEWRSEAFPRTGQNNNGERDSIPLSGRVYSTRDNASRFHIGVDDEVKDAQLWKGVSGAPVFVGNNMLGVIVGCDSNYTGKRLIATPLWKLLKDVEFRNALGLATLSEGEERLNEIKNNMFKALEKHPEILSALKNEVLPSVEEYKSLDVIEAYLNLEIDRATEVINSVVLELRQNSEQENIEESLKAFRAIAYETLPVFYQFQASIDDASEQNGVGTGIISLNATISTIAEFIMAYRDGAAADFRTEMIDDFPRSEYRILGNTEYGIDPDGRQREADIHFSIHSKWGVGTIGKFKESFDEYFTSTPFVEKELQSKRFDFKKILANQTLNSEFKLKKRRHYFLIDLSKCENDKNVWIATVVELKKDYPEIEFVCMSDDETLLLEQRQHYLNLKGLFKFTKD